MNTNKQILLSVIPFIFSITLSAQSTKDTADNPYWIKMMGDKSINFYQTQRAFNLYWENRPITKGCGWKPFKRWEYMAEKEIDSLGNFPDVSYQLAVGKLMHDADNKLWDLVISGVGNGTAKCNVQGEWAIEGPTFLPANNTGQLNGMGRLNAIALHPKDTNIIYVGAASGGIWKTINGGQSWDYYADSLPTLGVSSIVIDPNNSDTIYFGSGDRDANDAQGFGVFKSTNGGKSWVISNSGMGNRTVGRLIIDPSNTANLLAACDNGIYRSTNYGVSWTQTSTIGPMKDIIFKPNNSQVVYATVNGLFYRSLNNGVTWLQITNGLPTSAISRGVIDANPLNPSLVYFWAANGSINKGFYLSRDSGATFVTQSTTPNLHDYATDGSGTGGQAWYNKDMVTDADSAGIIYVSGVNVFKSRDTGKTWLISAYWVNQVHADNHETVRCPITKKTFTVGDGGIYYTRSKGANWIDISSGLGISQIYKMGASRTVKDKLIIGLQDNGTANYNNGWFTTRGGDGMDCEVDQTDARYSYGELYFGNVFRVYDVNTQTTIAANGVNGITESGGWVTPITLREGSGNTMYIGYKNIWRSNNIRNNTPTWSIIGSSLGGVSGTNFTELESGIANSDILYASRSNGTFFRTDDANAAAPSWNTIVQPIAGTIAAIETDPKIEGAVYIGVSNRVYRSLNKGTSWTYVNGTNLPSNINCVLLDTASPKKGIYVGTLRSGVWYTDTTLSSWRYFSKGMPATANVTDIELYYEKKPDCNCSKLYASTYNKGVYSSNVYNDGTAKPLAKLEKYDSVVCKNGVVNFSAIGCNNPTEYKWSFSPNTVIFINGTSDSSQNASVRFSGANTTYLFKYIVENCNGLDTLEGKVIVGDTVIKATCVGSTTNNFSGLGIFNVKFESINRRSLGRNPEGQYVDLACTNIAKVKRGQNYRLNVTTGLNNTEQVKAFVDYNNDGDFVDVGEMVYTPAAAMTNHSDTFTIPLTAPAGKIVRFRIRSDFVSLGTSPCSVLAYGQTEDYGLYIESDSVFPKFVQNDSVICTGRKVVFTDSTKGGLGYPYLWNFGAGASPATSAAIGPHTITYSSGGYKSVTLTVDGKVFKKDSAVFVQNGPDLNLLVSNNDTNVCAGKNIVLSALDANASGASFQWQKNGLNILDSTFNVLRLNNVSLSDSALYSVIAKVGNCADTFKNRLIAVHAQPVSTFLVSADSLCFKGHQFNLTNNSSLANGTVLNSNWQFGDASNSVLQNPTKSYVLYGSYTIKLVSSTVFGCKDSMLRIIKVNPSPMANFSVLDSNQCLTGNKFDFLSGSTIPVGTLTHLWKFGDGNTSGGVIPAHTYLAALDSVMVRLIVSSTSNCIDSVQKRVNINPMPVAAFALNNASQCLNNNSFIFTNQSSVAKGTLANNWAFGDANTSLLNNPTYSYSNFGAYTVKLTVTSNQGCIDSAKRITNVYENAKPNFMVNDSQQCFKNHSFVFSNSTILSIGSYTNLWKFGNGDTSTAINPLSKSYALLADTYAVKLIAKTNQGCTDSITKLIFLKPMPASNFSINTIGQCLTGNNFIFTSTASIAKGAINHAWNFGNNMISILNNPSHSYAFASDSFRVSLINTSNFGCVDSVAKHVYVYYKPIVDFSIDKISQCLNGNNFGFLNLSGITKGNLSYFWQFGNGATSGSLSTSHVYATAGVFNIKLICTSEKSCKDSVTKAVTVHSSSVPNFTINMPMQCFRGNAFSYSDNSTLSAGSYTNTWSLGDGTTAGNSANQNKIYTNFVDSLNVKLVNTTNNGCKDSTTKKVYLKPTPQANYSINDSTQCLQNNNFIFANSSSFVNAATSYQWTFGDGNGALSENPSHIYFAENAALLAKLVVKSDFGCTDSIAKLMVVYPNPQSLFSINDTAQCFVGNNFIFTDNSSLSSGGFNTSWRISNGTISTANPFSYNFTVSGSYTITNIAVSAVGCQDSSKKAIIVYRNPQANFSLNKDSQCLIGNNFSLNDISLFGGTSPNRNWYANNSILPSVVANAQNSFGSVGNKILKLVIVSAEGCRDSLERTVTVVEHPVFRVLGDEKLCLNQNLDLTAQSTDPNLRYEWQNNNQTPVFANPFTVIGNTAGVKNIKIKASNTFGCKSDSIYNSRVVVYKLPNVAIDTSVIALQNGIELSIKDVSNIPILSRNWTFIPTGSGIDEIEKLIFLDTTSLSVTLSLIDTNGCEGVLTKQYFITIPNGYFLPNAFSPNKDNRNDVFGLTGLVRVKKFEMHIYNRWGEKLFQTNNPNQGWDGTYGGELVQNGGYSYYMELIDFEGKKVVRKGTLMIVN